MVSDQLLYLASGLDMRAYRYKSILINGWRFNTKDRELQLKSQNSEILVKGDETKGNLDYFGELMDIIKLNYQGEIVSFYLKLTGGMCIIKVDIRLTHMVFL